MAPTGSTPPRGDAREERDPQGRGVEEAREPIAAIICGRGRPWQRGIWIGYRRNGRLEIESAQSQTSKPRIKSRRRRRS
jgi:hypothetical protein